MKVATLHINNRIKELSFMGVAEGTLRQPESKRRRLNYMEKYRQLRKKLPTLFLWNEIFSG